MKKWLFRGLLVVLVLLCGLTLYGTKGYYDAQSDAPRLRKEAKALADKGLGSDQLGAAKRALLIAVEDPTFDTNNGTDFSTPGAGQTTITQSLSKRLASNEFKPGIRKIRQTGYAIGLSRSLTKNEVLTLALSTGKFRGSDGEWISGFDAASRRYFAKSLADLDRSQFLVLVASIIAPNELAPDAPNAKLIERVARIENLVQGKCKPSSYNDVWLEGCKLR